MTSVVTFVVLAVATHALAGLLIRDEDRRWVSKLMAIAWGFLFSLVALVNQWFPYSGGGDDQDYVYLAEFRFESWADILDLTKFTGMTEQAGYPWLLSIMYQFTGSDLVAMKLLNVAAFVMLIPVWLRIGATLQSREFGRAMAIVVFLLTPLWYYTLFPLKDMTITLLQSLFLLGLVQITRGKGLGSWLLCMLATVALIPFRSHLVLVNAAVLAAVVVIMAMRYKPERDSVITVVTTVVLSGALLSVVYAIASDFQSMSMLGVSSERRVIGSAAVVESVDSYSESSDMNRALFPLLYVFSETAGLSPQTWQAFDGISLRGALALPWIFVGVPFFAIGLWWLVGSDPRYSRGRGIIAKVQSVRFIATPWSGVVMFMVAYMAVSWTVGDTTRWRLPDMPAMAAVALAGWISTAPRMRLPILLLWVFGSGAAFGVFYLYRGL